MTSLDRLEALEKEATRGPWETGRGHPRHPMRVYQGGFGHAIAEAELNDAVFIVAFRNAAPALIAAARDLAEIHEYHCGCDQPGRLDLCVAKPTLSFAALARLNPEAPDA